MAGAIPGMFLGAILGSGVKGEKWAPVSIESVTQLRVVPRWKGVCAQLSVLFPLERHPLGRRTAHRYLRPSEWVCDLLSPAT